MDGEPLIEPAAGRGHQHRARGGPPERFHGGEDRLAFHDHPLASAVRHVVGRAVLVRGPVAQIVALNLGEAASLSALHHALAEGRGRNLREEGEDVDAHEEV